MCDKRCCAKTGRWCDACWAQILLGGWEHLPEPTDNVFLPLAQRQGLGDETEIHGGELDADST